MQYENYQRKIEKIASVMKWLFKHLTMVIIIASATVVSAAALVAAKGTVTDAEISALEVVYGESIETRAKAFLSSAEFEYARSDSEDWSSEAPTMPGTYKVRAVARAAFGTHRYRDVGSFTISPKSITVAAKGDELMLGDSPEAASSELVAGDEISSYEFDIEYLEGEKLEATPVDGSIVFKNAKGEDVSAAYSVTVSSKVLSVVEREITVRTDSAEKVYDGTPLVSGGVTMDESTLRDLLPGHSISATAAGALTNVGVGENVIDPEAVRILDADGVDVTRYYGISIIHGTLTVTKRQITAESVSDSFVYDGGSHSNSEYDITSEIDLVEGHIASISGFTSVVTVGTVNNDITLSIADADGNDVSANYDISYVAGTLEVTKRTVTIYTPSIEWTYDGASHSAPTIDSVDNIVDGHSAIVDADASFASITDVGEKLNSISAIILDADGNDVSENYEIVYFKGTLKVSPRPILVKPDDLSLTYDGAAHTAEGASLIIEGEYLDLADGYYLVAEFGGSQKNVGTATITITKVYIYSENADETGDFASNYKIDLAEGVVEITKRSITVSFDGAEKIYDGAALSTGAYTVGADGLADGHELMLGALPEITNVGSVQNIIEILGIKDEDGENVIDNYDIADPEYGMLTVNVRKVHIVFGSAEKTYDGTALSNNAYDVTLDGIAEGHTLVLGDFPEIINVGSCINFADILGVTDANGEYVDAGNYNITYDEGTLTVTVRKVHIVFGSAEKTYDGTALSNEGYGINLDGIAEGQTLVLGEFPSITKVGSVINKAEIIGVTDAAGEYVSDNYEITYDEGILEITKRSITVTSESASKIYDALALENQRYAITGDGIAPGEIDVLVSYTTLTGAGSVENNIKIIIKRDGSDGSTEETTENYDITYVNGTLTVDKRPVYILPNDLSVTYDDTYYKGNGVSVVVEGDYLALVEGQQIDVDEIVYESEYRDAGEYDIVVTALKIMSGGEDVTDNYDITYGKGKLTIAKRALAFVTNSSERAYDGTALSNHSYTITDGSLAALHTLVIDYTGRITLVGETENSFSGYEIETPDGRIVTDNYDITADTGTLKVIKRAITVTTGEYKGTYDGKEHSNSKIEITGEGIASTDEYTATDYLVVKNVTDILNERTITITHSEYGDVTANYEITYEYGQLLVDYRYVTINTGSYEWVYDGNTHTYLYPKAVGTTSFASGQSAHIKGENYASITDVVEGGVKNIYEIIIETSSGEDVTANYVIDYKYGTLTVKPRPITVKPIDIYKLIYDGEYHGGEGIELIASSLGLVGDHELLCSLISGGGTEPAKYTLSILAENVKVMSGERDVTFNYEISVRRGTLEIIQRLISIYTGSSEKMYDGTELTNGVYGVVTDDPLYSPLLEGHTLTLTVIGSITDVGSAKNLIKFSSVCITDENGNDVTDKYGFDENTFKPGTLTVTKRTVYVEPLDVLDIIYDDNNHVATEYRQVLQKDVYYSLVLNHYFDNVVFGGGMRDVGEGTTTITSIKIYSYSNEVLTDVTKNYDIVYGTAKVTVLPRAMTLTTHDKSRGYDATPLVHYGYGTTGMLGGDYISKIVFTGRITDFGKTENTIDKSSLVINSGKDGRDVTKNYDITYVWGTLSINYLELTIRPSENTYLYDGTVKSPEKLIYVDGALAEGHTIEFEYKNCSADAGTYEISIINVVIKEGERDVTDNYAISTKTAKLVITKRQIYITTGSDEKNYDGTALTKDAYTENKNSDGLVTGHILTLPITGSQTLVGQSNNGVDTSKIKVMSGKDDVTKNYDFHITYGTLTVKKSVTITVVTNSASKEYDGLPLVADDYIHIVDGQLAKGDSLLIKVTGKRTEVGISDNTVLVTVKNAEGDNVTSCYEIKLELGVLEVLPDDGDSDDEEDIPGDSGLLDTSGSIATKPGSGTGAGPNGSSFSYYITTDKSGFVYLKVKSFGNFNGTGWDEAVVYDELIEDKYAAAYLLALAAGYSDYYGDGGAHMTIVSKYDQFALPYYALPTLANIVSNDVEFDGDASDPYEVIAYLLTTLDGIEMPENYIDFELAYREFVYENYLYVDEKTEDYMIGIIDAYGWDKDTKDIIRLVAEYIQRSARYNPDFNEGLIDGDNIIINFLDVYGEGICQHYASAATMLYRTLGIPARYTIGFAADLTAGANNYVTASNAHAWVEVYIDGLGWVAIEVTPGDQFGDIIDIPERDDEQEDDGRPKLTITPEYVCKKYDGTPLLAPTTIALTPALEALIKEGYYYEVTIEGERTLIGVGYSKITSFKLFDPNDEDVTDQYNIKLEKGRIEVREAVITLMLDELKRDYNGERLEFTAGDYELLGLPEGFSIELIVDIGLTNIGRISRNDINYDLSRYISYEVYNANGEKVTKDYKLVVDTYRDYNPLTITPVKLVITADSAAKVYDGEKLEQSTYHFTLGSVVPGQTLYIKVEGSILNVGSVKNKILASSVYILDENEVDVTKNYEITLVNGTLTVNKRPITVIGESYNGVYDGEAHYNISYTVTGDHGLAKGEWDELRTDRIVRIENVGSKENTIYIRIYKDSADGKSKVETTSNYDITYIYGTLEVTKRPITIVTSSADIVYDGYLHAYGDFKADNLVLGQYAVSYGVKYFENAAEYENEFWVYIYDYEDGDVTYNYEITYEYGTVKINKRKITVTTASSGLIYDGALHSAPYFVVDNYADNQVGIIVGEAPIYSDAGSFENAFEIMIYDMDYGHYVGGYWYEGYWAGHYEGGYCIGGYNVSGYYDGGYYTPRVWVDDYWDGYKWIEGHYEGGEYIDYYWVDGYYVEEECIEQYWVNDYWVDGYWVDGYLHYGELVDVTDNYEITYDYGTINVYPREITLKPSDDVYLYDDTAKTPSEIEVLSELGIVSWHNIVTDYVVGEDGEGSKTNAGTYTISFKNLVIMNGDEDVTKNYDITLLDGEMTINKRVIYVTTASAEKAYDGTPLTADKFEYGEGSDGFAPDHYLTLPIIGSQTEVGSSSNTVDLKGMKVTVGERDVTDNYDIVITEGTLNVVPAVTITVITNSASKEYDGTPLTANDYIHFLDGKLIEGHTLVITVTGERTEVGVSDNTVDVVVTDENGKDVTYYYKVVKQLGSLEVTEKGELDKEHTPDGSDGGGILDTSGDINAKPGEGTGAGDNGDNFCYYITTDTTGHVYLKVKSFGDYTGTGWAEAVEYEYLIDDQLAATYLLALAAANKEGITVSNMNIVSKYGQFALPYFAIPGEGNVQISDTVVSGDAASMYLVQYILLASALDITLPEELVRFEKAYREFVYENYLSIDEESEDYMIGIIEANGWSRSTEDIVNLVAEYIRNAAKYNLEFAEGLANSENIAVDFLKTYKEGVCRHYASAATLLYRALGIPARYTVGFSAPLIAGADNYITASEAHAWVEVYIDGLGWVVVEVTGSGDGEGGESEDAPELPDENIDLPDIDKDKEEDDERQTIIIKPEYVYKVYDGTPLYAVNLVNESGLLAELLAQGYRYEVVVSGERTSVGRSYSRIEKFILYNKKNAVVTDQFDIRYETGWVEVRLDPIIISLYQISKHYDGTALEFADEDYEIISIPEGFELALSLHISLTNVGRITASDINYNTAKYMTYTVTDADGNDVTEFARVIVDAFPGMFEDGEEYVPLIIEKTKITVTTMSSSKPFDGEALTSPIYYITGSPLGAGDAVDKDSVVMTATITNLGKVDNTINQDTFRILNAAGEDVTDCYDITFVIGTLTITPAPTE